MTTPFKLKYNNSAFPFKTDITKSKSKSIEIGMSYSLDKKREQGLKGIKKFTKELPKIEEEERMEKYYDKFKDIPKYKQKKVRKGYDWDIKT